MPDLYGTRRIELVLPTGDELPRVMVPIQLPSRAARSGPVLLASQNCRRAWARPGIVLEFVIGLAQKDGDIRGLVVRVEHFGIGGQIGVGRIQGDNGRPGAIIE